MKSSTACDTANGYVDHTIMEYPATVQGCFNNGKVTKGKCLSTAGTPV